MVYRVDANVQPAKYPIYVFPQTYVKTWTLLMPKVLIFATPYFASYHGCNEDLIRVPTANIV